MTHNSHRRCNDNRLTPRRRAVTLTPLIGAVTLLLAACGSHSGTPASSQQAQNEAPLIAYAKCMRSHGISDFPDPSISSTGGIGYSNTQAQAINRNSRTYQIAETGCQSLPGATTAQQLLKLHS